MFFGKLLSLSASVTAAEQVGRIRACLCFLSAKARHLRWRNFADIIKSLLERDAFPVLFEPFMVRLRSPMRPG
jgi:hypothetical protein